MIPWSPLGGGLLGGVLGEGRAGGARRRFEKQVDSTVRLERYEALCGEMGEKPGTVALAWLLHNPAVTAPIVGPRTVEQLESAVRATEITLTRRARAIGRNLPRPRGEAPEAYAW